jgi:hypothetical protein
MTSFYDANARIAHAHGKGHLPALPKVMSDLKDKAKEKIEDAADAAKKATGKVVDKSKDVAHSAGKKMEQGGKWLQDA